MSRGGVTVKGKKQLEGTGDGQSLIVKLGLEPIVQELRLNKGWGGMKIAKYLLEHHNEYLKETDPNISVACVNRYLKTKGINNIAQENLEESVNIYRVECESLAKIIAISEAIYDRIEECSRIDQEDPQYDNKLLIELSKSYRELDTRKSALVASIGAMQAKVFTWANATEIVNRVVAFVQQKDPMLAHQIREYMENDPVLYECMKRIKVDK